MASVTKQERVKSELNRLQCADRAAHDWYRFVLSFPPHLVREYLQRFAISRKHTVLDPFCGTGTTLVECKKLGIPSIGIEANPMAALASRIKTDWSPNPASLMTQAESNAEKAINNLASEGVEDEVLPLLQSRHQMNGHKSGVALRRLPPESQKLLLTNCISPLPLHKTLVLLDQIKLDERNQFKDHQRLALAKALVFEISNLHFGPEVGLGPIKKDVPVVSTWLSGVRAMANDLDALKGAAVVPVWLHEADSRRGANTLASESVDMVITSPPYPNEKDYTRTTRLESVLLGLIHNKADLRALKRRLIRSNTRGVYKSDNDDELVATHEEIQRIATAIEARRIELGKTSGFERLYARVTKLYFGGMMRHLAELRPSLRPGAILAYVVGDQASYLRVMIRTGQLLGDIARSLGYELLSIDLFRTRIATATKEQLREEVVVLRWPGSRSKANGKRLGRK